MVLIELDSERVDFTRNNDVDSRWCDDDGRVHLDKQLGNGDVSVEDGSDFELPFPQKNELQSRPLDRERFFHLKIQQRSMQMNGTGTMDADSINRRGNGSEKYVPFDIENKSERGMTDVEPSIFVGGDGSLGKDSQNPISLTNIFKTLFFILVWYTFSLFLTL